jgi:hypothetical protein
MGKKIAGTCYIKVDGIQFEVEGSVEFPLIHTKRETVMSDAGPAGFSEMAIAPYIKFTGIIGKEFPRDKLEDATDMTVTAEAANGMVYTLSGAFLQGEPPAMKASEGKADLEFGGMKGSYS